VHAIMGPNGSGKSTLASVLAGREDYEVSGEVTYDGKSLLELSPEARAGETAAFGLRMNAGWRFDEFQSITGFDLRAGWSEEMNRLVAQGWAEQDDTGFRLNARGLRFADAAAEEFLRLPAQSPALASAH